MKRILRFLPPLVVALLLGFVVWRVARDDPRVAEREALEVHWTGTPGDPEAGRRALEAHRAYVERFGHRAEDRWFAARSLLRSGVRAEALQIVWDDPALRRETGTGRRLAGLLLRTMGWADDEALTKPRDPHDTLLPILVDGGAEDARALLMERFETQPWPTLPSLFLAIQMFGGEGSREAAIEALRARGDAEGDLGAAILATRPEPYAERERDGEVLRDFVSRPIEEERRLLWSMACRALGRLEDPEALATLEAVRARILEGDPEPIDQMDAAMASIGMVTGGRWDAKEAAGPHVDPAEAAPEFADAWLQAVLHRWRRGDAQALEEIRTWWQAPGRPGRYAARPRLLYGLFLRDGEIPPADGPVAFVEEDLARTASNDFDQMLLAAIQLRRGDRAGRDGVMRELVAFLHGLPPGADAGLALPIEFHPVPQGARALYLYDR